MILFLFSETYPYDGAAEQTFLQKEIEMLEKRFDRVIVVPRRCEGQLLSFSSGVEVDTSYASYLKSQYIQMFFCALISPYTYLDLWKRPAILGNLTAFTRLVKFVGKAELTRKWLQTWLRQKNSFHPSDCVLYTYWFDDTAFGLGLAKNKEKSLCIVSRAHGYDLYEERYEFPYWPCRFEAIEYLDFLFPDSDAGVAYIRERYPDFRMKVTSSLLGVQDPGFVTSASQGGYMRIVSCSKLVPVKRINLLMEGVAKAAVLRSDLQFVWTHFGDGESRMQMQEEAVKNFPENASANFFGYESQQALLNFYQNNPVDVFVNVSKSEGTPVSIMEAISCGIPVIATAVGGNVEIVTEQNGVLLNPNPSVDEVAKALIAMYEHQLKDGSKREGSLQVWRSRYSSEINFSNFADKLISLRNDRG